jgi:hypothetical protein
MNSSTRSEIVMRKLVVILVALLALFTFIRDFPSATPHSSPVTHAELEKPFIP